VHAGIRHDRGNPQFFDELARRTDEVEQVIRGGPEVVGCTNDLGHVL
jgi:hypothetical protein